MNPSSMSLAQARFHAALCSGSSATPASLSQLLSQLSTSSQSHTFDAELIRHSIGDEFPFLRNMIASGMPPDAAASLAWEAAVRWVLNELRDWDSSEVNSLIKLRVLLSAITALDAYSAGITGVAFQVTSTQLIAGLKRLIESTDAAHEFNDQHFSEIRQQIESMVNSGNLDQLRNILSRIKLFPSPDFWTAVVLMYYAEPSVLASIIEDRNNVLFSLIIRTVLGNQAIALAARVNNLDFKFVSVANLCQESKSGSLQGLLEPLLLQVAQSSAADWAAWMQALFKYPGDNASLDSALAAVLWQLSPDHWTLFFKVLSLDYSHGAAAPVAKILIQFANSPNAGDKTLMWETAYNLWDGWNYGRHESEYAMFAPAACALDFPVAMYYASLQSSDRLAVESNLLQAIETLEQQWFNSLTELVTERNRLKSRLRLVQHGTALANGSDQELPPPIQPDADLYAQTRYPYHDIFRFQ